MILTVLLCINSNKHAAGIKYLLHNIFNKIHILMENLSGIRNQILAELHLPWLIMQKQQLRESVKGDNFKFNIQEFKNRLKLFSCYRLLGKTEKANSR